MEDLPVGAEVTLFPCVFKDSEDILATDWEEV